MNNRILLIGLVVMSFATGFLFLESIRQKQLIAKHQRESEALNNYVKLLKDKLSDYETGQQEAVEIPKNQVIRELLNSYMRDRTNPTMQYESAVTMDELRSELEDYQLKQRFIPNIVPINGEYAISQRFSDKHKAVDFAASAGTEVVAGAAGVVKSVYQDKYFGNVVVIDHLNHYMSFYAHLAKSFYQQGFFVEKGQVIGLVGSSGFSRHPHLHYEIFYRGTNQNPLEIIR